MITHLAKRSALGCCLVAWCALQCPAQMPSGQSASSSSRATNLPLSGQSNAGGAAQVQQTSTAGTGVNTIDSSVQVSGALSGSIRTPEPGTGPIRLSLADAIKRGLGTNLGSVTATNSGSYARASRMESLSNLLPTISLNASETVTQVNLAAYGLSIQLPASSGLSFPTVVGPYQYQQLQGQLSQSVFNLVQIRNYKGSKENEKSVQLSSADTRELVVLAIAGAYLQTVADAARLISQGAQLANAEAVYQQAQVRKAAGVNSRIDVMRSLVELQTQQQRLNAVTSDLAKQKLNLARLVGLPLDRELVLSDAFAALSPTAPTVPSDAEAIALAMRKRSDLRASEAQVRVAELAVSAARAERYPTVSLTGNYGTIGPAPDSQHGVFAVTGAVTVPLYAGGRMKADRLQAETALNQRLAELADQQGRVESDVRAALIELRTAAGQVKLATTNRDYANETLTEARDRFQAGVATTVEVVQAQEQVASAESDYISSYFSFNVARLSLARATGEAEANIPDLLHEKQP